VLPLERKPNVNAPASDEIEGIWVNSDYLRESGLLKKLADQGFKLRWESANNEASSVDLLCLPTRPR
jgi:hypothetical protein